MNAGGLGQEPTHWLGTISNGCHRERGSGGRVQALGGLHFHWKRRTSTWGSKVFNLFPYRPIVLAMQLAIAFSPNSAKQSKHVFFPC